jgi:hypothetical protein
MSFDTLKVKELRDIADAFAVEVPVKITKQELIMLLEEEGVNFDTYRQFSETEKVEVEPGPDPRPQAIDPSAPGIALVKMVRANMSYQVGNYVFSKEHPFVPMPEDHAQRIFDGVQGFVLATPREVQEFYR